jgi:hypothetical protein
MSHCCNKNVEGATSLCGGNTMAGLIIFILIILQFQKRNGCKEERNSCEGERNSCKEGGNNQLFDNSVLFILVLFIIACCGKVKLGC